MAKKKKDVFRLLWAQRIYHPPGDPLYKKLKKFLSPKMK